MLRAWGAACCAGIAAIANLTQLKALHIYQRHHTYKPLPFEAVGHLSRLTGLVQLKTAASWDTNGGWNVRNIEQEPHTGRLLFSACSSFSA